MCFQEAHRSRCLTLDIPGPFDKGVNAPTVPCRTATELPLEGRVHRLRILRVALA